MSDLTQKQEAFVVGYFECGNAAEAYRRAYDCDPNARDWVYVEACQLLGNPKIARRLAELRERAEVLAIYTRHKAMEELEEARVTAKSQGQAAAMVSATSAKVKLCGLEAPTVHKHTGAVNVRHSASDLSDDDLARIASGGSAGASASSEGSD